MSVNILWYRTAAFLARCGFRCLGGLKVVGAERVPMSGPLLVAPIHVSHFDPPIVGATCPRPLRFMAKEELFRSRLFGGLIRSLGAYPVRRGESDTATIRKTIEWLQEGSAVLVFPEGSRGNGEEMKVIQSGIAVLAKRTGATILPVGINGTFQSYPRGAKKPKRAKFTVVYGEPFRYADLPTTGNEKQDRSQFAQELRERIARAANEAGLAVKTSCSATDQTGSRPPQTPS
ncbi:MAG: 1-acyl-sn-glycerol-3-phosphate acyltransferase [Armatimonadetes bacterium]|nr:1-acyl-sn-glycerol-3-phosphate acyltransferase [Armatimonadota bacterium]